MIKSDTFGRSSFCILVAWPRQNRSSVWGRPKSCFILVKWCKFFFFFFLNENNFPWKLPINLAFYHLQSLPQIWAFAFLCTDLAEWSDSLCPQLHLERTRNKIEKEKKIWKICRFLILLIQSGKSDATFAAARSFWGRWWPHYILCWWL